MPLDPEKLNAARPQLEADRNCWMATVRPDGRPHLVPVWFVWFEEKVWISTPCTTVKIKNLAENDQMSVSLEDGNKPVILEGTSVVHQSIDALPEPLLAVFKSKYDWDIVTDDDADYCMIEFQPNRMLSW